MNRYADTWLTDGMEGMGWDCSNEWLHDWANEYTNEKKAFLKAFFKRSVKSVLLTEHIFTTLTCLEANRRDSDSDMTL